MWNLKRWNYKQTSKHRQSPTRYIYREGFSELTSTGTGIEVNILPMELHKIKNILCSKEKNQLNKKEADKVGKINIQNILKKETQKSKSQKNRRPIKNELWILTASS